MKRFLLAIALALSVQAETRITKLTVYPDLNVVAVQIVSSDTAFNLMHTEDFVTYTPPIPLAFHYAKNGQPLGNGSFRFQLAFTFRQLPEKLFFRVNGFRF